jgi:hypothetical protein
MVKPAAKESSVIEQVEELGELTPLSGEEYFDTYIMPKLFDRLSDLVLQCQDNRYTITDYVSTTDLLDFLIEYIDYSNIEEMLEEEQQDI